MSLPREVRYETRGSIVAFGPDAAGPAREMKQLALRWRVTI
jgi:hypothetical protein